MQLTPTDCLLIIDVQNDFLPGGALAVPDGDQVIPAVNRLAKAFGPLARTVLTQDWHPREHVSFAVNHPPSICRTASRYCGRCTACNTAPVPRWPIGWTCRMRS